MMNSRRLRDYALLMRMDKPIGSALLLWPTLWALWLAADGPPTPWVGFVFVAGVFLMRSAGCVINDLADRDIDPHVDRTRDRPRRWAGDRARGSLAVRCTDPGGVCVGFDHEHADRRTVVRGHCSGDDLPVDEKIYPPSSGLSGCCVWMGNPHGFCRGDWHGNANGMVSAGDQYSLGHRLRHDVCDVGPRRRFAHRRKVIGNFVRPR